ncbi:bifunctional 5,10-methylenetetrahydrofolate dehydrogenase/5,10-methenyltetrahydrofolate cyclohydrolase [Candidatus Micrarchaeota archaeon]|nr:bifunctional 5,10-methylenetetrahydrofolate dehydrogenase/5,10-methenyltetrahydrofolate cyclohydrolase [Candidatus Micrarchaeota archaeon]
MYRILKGKEVADSMLEETRVIVEQMERKPHLAIVLVGNDPASEVYVKKKLQKAETVGIRTTMKRMDENTSEEDVLKIVEQLNDDSDVDGFIVQAPLPKQIDFTKIVEMIKPEKDVDGWTSANMGRMFVGLPALMPATPLGVMKMLEYYEIELNGKNVTVIGRSNVVGKPLALMLLKKNATVTVCHSRTKNLSVHTKNADVVVAAVGKPGLVTANMIKEGAYVIDVGTTRVDGKIKGDVLFEEVIKKANCSPVPGGAGPMTVAVLISNVVMAAQMTAGK